MVPKKPPYPIPNDPEESLGKTRQAIAFPVRCLYLTIASCEYLLLLPFPGREG